MDIKKVDINNKKDVINAICDIDSFLQRLQLHNMITVEQFNEYKKPIHKLYSDIAF